LHCPHAVVSATFVCLNYPYTREIHIILEKDLNDNISLDLTFVNGSIGSLSMFQPCWYQ
jgi:hypothetical protein